MSVVDTLLSPVLEQPALSGGRCLFLNACAHVDLVRFSNLVTQQVFKTYAGALGAAAEIPDGVFDTVLILAPKNKVEARYLMAAALERVAAGGQIFVAADNKVGAGSLKKMLSGFGLEVAGEFSKHKARCIWARVDGFDAAAVKDALAAGAQQEVLGGAYVSQPGVFGWDKVDAGSEILAAHLPEVLSGRGADFGCGYGYLSRAVLERAEGLESLTCLDADARAVECCEINLTSLRAQRSSPESGLLRRSDDLLAMAFEWRDLTQDSGLRGLDFIVMNPPFHEGRATDSSLGAAFIRRAAEALRSRGVLYMVANVQLPYESVLAENFGQIEKLYEGRGFKVYKAVR